MVGIFLKHMHIVPIETEVQASRLSNTAGEPGAWKQMRAWSGTSQSVHNSQPTAVATGVCCDRYFAHKRCYDGVGGCE